MFPGGALFLACREDEFKLFLISQTSTFLKKDNRRCIFTTNKIGRNVLSATQDEWIFSTQARVDQDGVLIESRHSKFILLDDCSPLSCTIQTPLDDGQALANLYRAIEKFMPDNAIACLATIASCAMGASYETIIANCGQMGVPFLFGDFGSCKSQATLCALSIFGAQNTHFFNNQTTPSYLFDAMKKTSIPLAIDDVNERTRDIWEEIIVDAYNNTPRGTRSYRVERFLTVPIVSANWMFANTKGRASTRCIVIPFVLHTDEPDATQLYGDLAQARITASSSAAQIIRIITSFSTAEEQQIYHEEIFPSISSIFQGSHTRFTSTMTTFMWFFLKVSGTCSLMGVL